MMIRVDRRKRPELFLSMAAQFPHVQFHIAGKSRVPSYTEKLKMQFNAPNITFHGFLDQFSGNKHHEMLEKAWILVNTATREALPNSFLEACAHQCAILSYVDPDEIATHFGFRVEQNNFVEGLTWLLEDHRWKDRGLKGYDYVKNTFAMDRAMYRHEEVYDKVWKDNLFAQNE